MKDEDGIGIFEFAGMLVLASSFLLLATGMLDYLMLSRDLARIVDREIYDGALKPLKLEIAEWAATVRVDNEALRELVEGIAERIEVAVRNSLPRETAKQQGVLIEACFGVLSIDPLSGSSLGFAAEPISYTSRQGSADWAPQAMSETDLSKKFLMLSVAQHQTPALSSVSLFAIPSASFGADGSTGFVPYAVLVGARIIVQTDRLTSSVLSRLGLEPAAYFTKTVSLRGEFAA